MRKSPPTLVWTEKKIYQGIFLKNKKNKKKGGEEEVKTEPEVPQEPCLQCKTCAHRLADDNHCRVYERKPSYIKNNRFECNEYKQK